MRQSVDDFLRIIEPQAEIVTVQRFTGTRRVTFSVQCSAVVDTGAASVLVGSVQQNADLVRLTDREMDAVKWPKPPRHGDQIVYADGSTRTVEGRAESHRLADGMVYFLKTLGG
jgi:hypothetical protein